MENKNRIVIINHSFQINYYSRRWQLFAESHPDWEVYCFAPAKHEWYKGSYSFGKSFSVDGKNIDNNNYHVRLFREKTIPFLGWYSPDFKRLVKEIQPNVIYHIGGHAQLSLVQLVHIAKQVKHACKVIAFSMRGPHHNIKKEKLSLSAHSIRKRLNFYYEKAKLHYVNQHVAAFFCHYPDALQAFKDEGYKGPIYMQTQVGVNEEWFHEDTVARKKIRDKYKIEESTFVFGSATRFSIDKGVDVILKALPKDGDWKYFMMGSGTEEENNRLIALIKSLHSEDKVIVTGFVDWYEMSKYWNAVDCAIHVPLTTKTWVETFSLAAVQPQITKKPVIGDDSGSVPYQIGFEDMIVPEGDVEALREKINWVLNHKDRAAEVGRQMYERTDKSFTVQHLNDMFYDTLLDVLEDKYDENKIDMTKYTPQKHEG